MLIKKYIKQTIISSIILASGLWSLNSSARSIPVETIHYPTSTTTATNHNRSGVWNPQPISTPWYAGGELGVGESANSNIGLAAGADIGYAFNTNLALEFNFLRLPYPNKKSNFLFDAATKISLPLSKQLNGFGKVGIGLMKTPGTSYFSLLLGGGVDYFLQSNLSVGAQLLGTVGTLNAQSFSILGSASYYFGSR